MNPGSFFIYIAYFDHMGNSLLHCTTVTQLSLSRIAYKLQSIHSYPYLARQADGSGSDTPGSRHSGVSVPGAARRSLALKSVALGVLASKRYAALQGEESLSCCKTRSFVTGLLGFRDVGGTDYVGTRPYSCADFFVPHSLSKNPHVSWLWGASTSVVVLAVLNSGSSCCTTKGHFCGSCSAQEFSTNQMTKTRRESETVLTSYTPARSLPFRCFNHKRSHWRSIHSFMVRVGGSSKHTLMDVPRSTGFV